MSDLGIELQRLWEQRPGLVLLLVVGFLIFLYLVIDAWRLKHRRKKGRYTHARFTETPP